MKRNCELCKSSQFESIYTQTFILVQNKKISYTVGSCAECGFAYASNLPSQTALNTFYKKNTKYTYHHNQGAAPEFMKKFYKNSFSFIDAAIKKNHKQSDISQIKILDIGCATGHLLSVFKENGYTDLLGIDPAPECRIAAKKIYGLSIKSLLLSEFKTKEKYDVVIISSVLEHIKDLTKSIRHASNLLKEGGLLFISVPDTENFGKILNEPFLEFSLEHINFFSRNSLKNLISPFGIKNIGYQSYPLDVYGGYALNTLWKKGIAKILPVADTQGKKALIKYISKSNAKLKQFAKNIDALVQSQEEVIVWGVGSLTSRLLATTNLSKANILAFVDSNTNLQGKKISGLPIKSPQYVMNSNTCVLISSIISGPEIKKALLSTYKFKGKSILL